MRFIFKLIMMFIVYNGFSQNNEKNKTRNIVTFPNGDEAITIIENKDTNVIQLTTKEDYYKYEMLDLSNHEAAHRSIKKREIIRAKMTEMKSQGYTVKNPKTEAANENEEEGSGSSGV